MDDFEIELPIRLAKLSPRAQRVAWEVANKRYTVDLEALASVLDRGLLDTPPPRAGSVGHPRRRWPGRRRR